MHFMVTIYLSYGIGSCIALLIVSECHQIFCCVCIIRKCVRMCRCCRIFVIISFRRLISELFHRLIDIKMTLLNEIFDFNS